MGSSRRRLLNQSTHSSVANSTASKLRQGPRRWIGKQINRRLVRLGYEGRKKTFHSIRKYVATCFENEGVDELKASRILGHNLQTMSYGLYSGGHDVEGLRDVIEVLQPLS